MDAKTQSQTDQAEIKIKLIENGVLVKTGAGWFTFDDDEAAWRHVKARLAALRAKREEDRLHG